MDSGAFKAASPGAQKEGRRRSFDQPLLQVQALLKMVFRVQKRHGRPRKVGTDSEHDNPDRSGVATPD